MFEIILGGQLSNPICEYCIIWFLWNFLLSWWLNKSIFREEAFHRDGLQKEWRGGKTIFDQKSKIIKFNFLSNFFVKYFSTIGEYIGFKMEFFFQNISTQYSRTSGICLTSLDQLKRSLCSGMTKESAEVIWIIWWITFTFKHFINQQYFLRVCFCDLCQQTGETIQENCCWKLRKERLR